MQNELKRIQQEMEITFIYVTHDQEEALAMSDTVVGEGNKTPPMIRSVVVLPHPLGPSSVRNSLSLIAFGLRIPKTERDGRKVKLPEGEIHQRVMEMLSVVNLKGFEKTPR